MEKALKFLENYMPLLMAYPSWFQYLTFTCIAVIALTMVIGIVLFPSANAARKKLAVMENVNVSVSVLANETTEFIIEEKTLLDYKVSRTDGVCKITPSMPYLDLIKSGGPIEPISYTWVPFEWDFPKLDVKIVNNSEKTILLTEAVFQIEKSQVDPTPVLLIKPDKFRSNALHFYLLNEGWGKAVNLKVHCNLIPLGPGGFATGSWEKPYKHTLNVGDVEEDFNIDVSSAFVVEGVDTMGLNSLQILSRSGDEIKYIDGDGSEITTTPEAFKQKRNSYFGKFKEGGALVCGEMYYTRTNRDGSSVEERLKFSTIVYLFNKHLAGVPRPPSYAYGVRFREQGDNYECRVNISQEIKPQETDRFTIKVGVGKSSYHKFMLSLLANNIVTGVDSVEMEIFVPRSGIQYLEKSAEDRKRKDMLQ
jgi:hypothetical protein